MGEHCDWDRVAYHGLSPLFLVEDYAPDTSCTFRIRLHSSLQNMSRLKLECDRIYTQKFTNNLERDETHIPFTRRDLVLPVERIAVRTDYKHIVEETPVYTLCRLIMRQFL